MLQKFTSSICIVNKNLWPTYLFTSNKTYQNYTVSSNGTDTQMYKTI